MTCPRCQRANRPDAQLCDTCGTPLEGATPSARSYAELKDEIDTLRRSLNEALEQQMATSEILRVISSSPTNLQPVLDNIAENAARVYGAYDATVFLLEGDLVRRVAHHGPIASHYRPARVLARTFVSGRAIVDRQPVHIHDILAPEADDLPEARESSQETLSRTILAVPLLRQGAALGSLTIRRREVHPFTDEQIALLQTFADQAVIAIENVRLFTEIQEKHRELTQAHAQMSESLEQQTATSEILSIISSSPTDLQPVFDTIVRSAGRLCEAFDVSIFRVAGDRLDFVAHHGTIAQRHGDFSLPLVRGTVGGRSVLESRTVQVADLQNEDQEFPNTVENARQFGFRTILSVPLLRDGRAIGGIQLRRTEVQPFGDKHVALLQTFADQAVIAIENVRLFKELELRNRDLTMALEQQTATGEILRVISSSPTDEKPVFDAIARSSVRLCAAAFAVVASFDGALLSFMAGEHVAPESRQALAQVYPMRPDRGQLAGRAILDRTVIHVADVTLDPEYVGASLGNRATLSVPMLRAGAPIGTITIARFEPVPFTDQQIELLKTFADQAVIAIENVRLFNETTEALERQTATGDILRVLSSSPTDAQPVFEAIADSAVRLMGAVAATVYEFDGTLVHLRTITPASWPHADELRRQYPRPPDIDLAAGRVILERTILHLADLQTDPATPSVTRQLAERLGLKSVLWVPMLREGAPIGVIGVVRATAGLFSEKEVGLLKTFADQAVIAIENVRLFTELAARNRDLTTALDRQTSTSEILRVISSSPTDVQPVFDTIVQSAARLCHAANAGVFLTDGQTLDLPANYGSSAPEVLATIRAQYPRPLDRETTAGVAILTRSVIHVPDIEAPSAAEAYTRRVGRLLGIRSMVAVPMMRKGEVVGAINLSRREPGRFPDMEVELLKTFADQAVIAIENVRLFRELEAANRELAAASQHKSEFLANMSHELRTPLNAIIGFSEVLAERMFGELNEKQDEYLRDIHASGQHLLSLINDILDLSKIEAGRMELELTDFDLPGAIDNALTLVRERAGRQNIALHHGVDARLGQIRGDERKLKQVLLNLLSNAIKFTPAGGRIDVRAALVDGMAEVAVADTGVGIAAEDHEAVFEEFRQVGTADKKVEGTGLGLTLSRKFVELHGGRIWVKSQVGGGSTFTFTIPIGR